MRISDWSSDVCSSDLFAGCIATAFQCEAHRGLQPGETEIAAGLAPQRPRQVEARGIAALCQPLDRRAAGIAQAEQLGGLVEGLTGGIVDGGARKSGVEGKRVSVRVDLGGRRKI